MGIELSAEKSRLESFKSRRRPAKAAIANIKEAQNCSDPESLFRMLELPFSGSALMAEQYITLVAVSGTANLTTGTRAFGKAKMLAILASDIKSAIRSMIGAL